MKRKSFTLIELLIVISVIAILAGLLLPAIGRVRDKAKKVKAKAEANTLVMAIKSYESTYGLLPWLCGECSSPTCSNPAHTKDAVWPTSSSLTAAEQDRYDTLLEILTGVDGPDNDTLVAGGTLGNARGIRFLDASSDYTKADTSNSNRPYGYRDPWGNRFGIAMDLDYDNKVNFGNPATDVQGTVFLWSFGPPQSGKKDPENSFGSSTSPACNVASWKE